MWSAISRLFVAKPRSSVKTPEPGEKNIVTVNNHNQYDINNKHYHHHIECNNDNSVPQANLSVHVFESMDRNMGDDRRKSLGDQQHAAAGDSEYFSDSYDTRQQRSIT
ncbi:hypothetical protein PV326_013669 [Microctonus aethiopoides]|nr:hypothetical protein PV326_013669 [Microctonus aethiopoides]